jgi:hypothetical protein
MSISHAQRSIGTGNRLGLVFNIFNEYLYAVFRFELANESRIPGMRMLSRHATFQVYLCCLPELTGYPQVFAASYQSITFTCFRRGWNALPIEKILFSAGNSDQPGCSFNLSYKLWT